MARSSTKSGGAESWLPIALGCAGLLGCDVSAGFDGRSPQGAVQPNVLLISIDSLRADHLGCYGYERPTSPTIDRLAADGVLFREALSTTSWTLPSHAAMLTGLHDSAHGVTDPSRRLAESHVTLAEGLRAAGYRTAGFYGGPFLHPVFGLDQGFELWANCMGEIGDSASREDVLAAMSPDDAAMHEDMTGPRTAAAVEAWAAQDDPRPFFAFVHLWDVHYDYLAPSEYVQLFDPDYDGPIDGLGVETMVSSEVHLSEGDLQHLVAMYDAEIRFTDDIIDRILTALRDRGMLANTVVVLTSDHGEEFQDHGGLGHQSTLFDEVLRVPLIISWPTHIERGQVVDSQVSLVSLAPTIRALARAEQAPSSGVDLGPLLAGDEPAPVPAISELLVDSPIYSLRTRELKVLYEPGVHPLICGYDLTLDPGETKRIKMKADPRIAAAVSIIEGLIEEGSVGPSNAGLEPELVRHLEQLGYLEAGAGDLPDED